MEEDSDLIKLLIFTDTLPEDKILGAGWDERYVNDISTYPGYQNTKSIAIRRDRDVSLDEMADDGYSLDKYKRLCKPTGIKPEEKKEPGKKECGSCCVLDPEENKCKYDDDKCNNYFVEKVKTWNEICGYHILFLQGETPGTPDHPGPWNRETEYVREPLIRILQRSILTLDSQPGLIVNAANNGEGNYDGEDEYLQKPYLEIAGPAGRIHRILKKILFPDGLKTLDNSIIKYVPHPVHKLDFSGYKNYQEDGVDYVMVTLGIDNPEYFMGEWSEYVLSNRFFDRIADIVETTP